MRIENVEKGLGYLGKLVVDLEPGASGKKGEGLDHALDMRVFASIGPERQRRGDLGIFCGDLRSHRAQEGRMGGECAEKYPKTAARLSLEADRCEDPHVERMIEAFAFLAGRTRLK